MVITWIIGILVIQGAYGFVNYEGYKLYSVKPENHEQVIFMHELDKELKYDFLKEGRFVGDQMQIMVSPKDQLNFEKELTNNGIKYTITVRNVERILQQERIERSMTRSSNFLGEVTFQSYMFYSEQMAYLNRLATDYPNIVTVEKIGQSYEGRDLLVLKVSSGNSPTTTPKPVIFIDAGIHAREWIAPPVALYIIQQLVENSANAGLYQNVDWAILPNLNPDGYEFTQSNDRLWRKNRRITNATSCNGTDLNRNFAYYWMYDGASDNPCSEIFAGTEAFSEPESSALRDYLLTNGQNVKLYLTFHSYGEMMLYPWGYNTSLSDDWEELQNLGEQAAAAIIGASTMNSNYVVNSSARALYAAAGGSDDWAKGEAGVALSYTIELPNGDAPFPFMLPAKQILPVVQETWEGVKTFHKYIEEKFWTNIIMLQESSPW